MAVHKKFQKTMILTIVLIFSSMNLPFAFSEETVDTSEVLYFLKNVANVDVSKYEPKLVTTTSEKPPEFGGLSHVTGKYTLESEKSTINVLFMFTDNTLSYCKITVVEGEIYQLEELSADIKVQADVFLQRYQAYTGDPTIEAMRNILDTVDVTENGVKVAGNIKIETAIEVYSSSTRLSCKNTFNGADYTSLSVRFINGSFASFGDDRSYYKIGGTDVNLSKEDAVTLALRHAKNLSWELLNGTKVTDFTIVEDKIGAQLLTQPREPLMLYPYWLVILPLDKMYPGFITQIMFQVWADTGKVITCTPLSQGGDVPLNVSSPTLEDNSAAPVQQENEPAPSTATLIASIAIAATIAIVITIAAFKKRHKKSIAFSNHPHVQ
ncbi:MAG: hypothetical protein NWE94_03605 [Candidatus Bathyarchaeota archaeon]|nr:hypothetical protein [Candidatus Bathyarchaeota archaeon]